MDTWLVAATIVALGLCSVAQGVSRVHTTGEKSWMMIPDGRGIPQLAILTEFPLEEDRVVDLHENVTLMLYTRANSEDGYRIYVDDNEVLENSGFNPQIPTKILVHGFGGDLLDTVIQDSRAAYLEHGEYNIIGVGWGPLCPSPLYNIAKRNALLVGPYLGELVDFLVRETGAQTSDFHFIGHSLGGQVVGIAGGSVSSGKVSRVTALDPALPLFGNEIEEERLDPSDADLVDVIHTDGGALGFWVPIGHVDFYPNGGKSPQPGCGLDILGSCSHGKSVEFFIDSILNRDKFPVEQCETLDDAEAESCSTGVMGFMGDAIGDTPPGIYYSQILPDDK